MSVKTLVVDNFKGNMTEFKDGDINSGMTNIIESFGYDSFTSPGNLTWGEDPIQIDPGGLVVTDLIMAGKERVESGILYVYAIGHTGRLYKIQVNDPNTFNPDYDNPVLLATLTSGSPTFTRGGFIDFFGATERIYIGHDKGVTRIDFDGTNETAISGSWTQTVPRPLKQFIGKLYIGNGSNIAEIDSTATVTSSAKLSPAFPSGTQVRDLDLSIDGNYMHIVVSSLFQADITSGTQDTTITSNLGSYIFKWNGTDTGYTASDNFPLVNLTSNIIFGQSQYTFGYDLRGVQIYDPIQRVTSGGQGAFFAETPFPNALLTDGQMVGWATTLYYGGHTELSYCVFGNFDIFVGDGYWSPMGMLATAPETDVVHVPYFQSVSNFGQGFSSNGYADNIFGTSKIYFSTLESSVAPTTAYKFYKWAALPVGNGTAASYSTYQTQNQLFSKKITIKEIRVYSNPWVMNNSFQLDLIGSSESPMTNGTKTFTAQNTTPSAPMYVGSDYTWWTPDVEPTYTIGLRLINLGTVNHVINKIEIDYDTGGK